MHESAQNKIDDVFTRAQKYAKAAQIKNNVGIVGNDAIVFAFWDGQSGGTKFVIDNCKRRDIAIKVLLLDG